MNAFKIIVAFAFVYITIIEIDAIATLIEMGTK